MIDKKNNDIESTANSDLQLLKNFLKETVNNTIIEEFKSKNETLKKNINNLGVELEELKKDIKDINILTRTNINELLNQINQNHNVIIHKTKDIENHQTDLKALLNHNSEDILNFEKKILNKLSKLINSMVEKHNQLENKFNNNKLVIWLLLIVNILTLIIVGVIYFL